jgi:hypothetical protein
MLKPQPHIYNAIDKTFKGMEIIFVDDAVCNFRHVLSRKNWTNVLFTGINCEMNKKLYTINDLEKLIDITSTSQLKHF